MGECNFMSERVINKLVNVLKKFTSCSLEKEIYLYFLVNFYDRSYFSKLDSVIRDLHI